MIALVSAGIDGLSAGWILAAALGGGAAAAAHLLGQRAGPVVVFPPAFLLAQEASLGAGRRRLRGLLAIAARAFAVALLALAFDRPQWVSAGDRREGGARVIVVDASASMTRRDVAGPLFDEALREADRLLGAAQAEAAPAAVVLAEARPRVLGVGLTYDVASLRRLLAEVRPTLSHASLADAIERAAALPLPAGEERRIERVHVIADAHAAAWQAVVGLPGVSIEPTILGPTGEAPNVAVTSLVVASAPAGDAGHVARVRVERFGDAPTPPAVVRVDVDGREPIDVPLGVAAASSTVDVPLVALPPWASVAATINSAAGPHYDNGRSSAALAVDQGDVRLVGDVATPLGRAARAAAEAVFGRERVAAVPNPEAADLAGTRSIILLGAARLDDDAIGVISTRLREGARVLWFVTGPSAPAASAFAVPGLTDLRPGPALQTPMRPAVSLQRALPTQMLAPVRSDLLLRAGDGAEAGDVIIRDAGGAPVATAYRVGRGRLTAVLADVRPDRSNLLRSPLFPAFLAELLSGGDADERPPVPEFAVGEPIVIAIEAESARRLPAPLVDDRGQPVRLRRAADGAITLRLEPAAEPGVLRVPDSNGAVVAAAAVAVDRAESDLTAVNPSALADRLRRTPNGDSSSPGAPASGPRDRAPLWPWLLAVVAAIVCVDAAGAARRARAAR